jgi:hypothetical protein
MTSRLNELCCWTDVVRNRLRSFHNFPISLISSTLFITMTMYVQDIILKLVDHPQSLIDMHKAQLLAFVSSQLPSGADGVSDLLSIQLTLRGHMQLFVDSIKVRVFTASLEIV